VGTEKQVLTRLYLVCDTKDALAETIQYYRDQVHVLDDSGNNMLLKGFDVNAALELQGCTEHKIMAAGISSIDIKQRIEQKNRRNSRSDGPDTNTYERQPSKSAAAHLSDS
jgi:hypothetical protein